MVTLAPFLFPVLFLTAHRLAAFPRRSKYSSLPIWACGYFGCPLGQPFPGPLISDYVTYFLCAKGGGELLCSHGVYVYQSVRLPCSLSVSLFPPTPSPLNFPNLFPVHLSGLYAWSLPSSRSPSVAATPAVLPVPSRRGILAKPVQVRTPSLPSALTRASASDTPPSRRRRTV